MPDSYKLMWWYRHQVMMRHQEHEFAMSNEAMLAEFMTRVSQVADVMDHNQPGQPEAAAKLREAVEDLRDVSQAEVNADVLLCKTIFEGRNMLGISAQVYHFLTLTRVSADMAQVHTMNVSLKCVLNVFRQCLDQHNCMTENLQSAC